MFGGTIIMSKDEKKENNKFKKIVLVIFLVLALLSSAFAIFEIFLLSSIENLIRYLVIVFLGLLDLVFILKTRRYIKGKKKKKNKKPKTKLFVFLMILYTIICFCVGGAIYYLYGKIDNLNKTTITYTSDLLVLSSNEAESISDITDMTIGILSDTTSPEGYIIPKEIIKENNLEDENEIVEYDDYTSMLVDMYSGDIDGMFVSDSYVSMFSGITGYESIETDTKVIISKDKKIKKSSTSSIETASSGKSITEPFTILLMGIDSTDDVLTKNAVANGDTLILITFNPKTLNATMISIPRDSYVPIACWSGQTENKITHAAAYGNDCMINTIQNYFDVTIDYYAKINFKGLVKLVDAVGGVEIDVEQTLCTDNSNRESEVCINPGLQTLNGEQALVYARNRKSLSNGDFGRGLHQQEIVKALINKMKTITDVSTFMDILNTVSNNIDTNLTTKQILSFYNVGKDIIKKSLSSDDADLINIQQLYLQGTGQMIYDERTKLVLYDYVPNKSSKKDVIQAMKENLELTSHEDIKEFSFSINDQYEKTIIGYGPYSTSFSYTLLPSFIGLTEAQARATASKYGVSVSFVGTSGTVVSQSYPANKRVDLISGSVSLTLSGSSTETTTSTNNKDVTTKDDTDESTVDNDTSSDESADTGSESSSSGSTDSDSDT
jgi:LCP family protein required for cell wall assembly